MRSGIDVEVGHRVRSVFAAILLAGMCACTGAPLALEAPTPSTAATSTLPLVVAGQSNAVNVAPFLREVYPQAVLSDSTQGGRPIASWRPDEQPPSCGRSSRTRYTSPCTPWSGGRAKAIARTPATSTTCASWSVRIRRENNNPALPIVVIRVLDLPSNAAVRSAQLAFVAGDPSAVLVSSDGPAFQDGTTDHLTDAGYREVALRIVSSLR